MSFNKGLSLSKLRLYEKAIESYTKAEEDTPNGKYPSASLNKGANLDELGLYEKAIESYTKAEKDSENEKYPRASFNKGLILYNFVDVKGAILSFQKAIEDSDFQDYPKAYIQLSKCYLNLGEYNKGLSTIFQELYRYNRNYQIIHFLVDNLSLGNLRSFYNNRKQYLELDLLQVAMLSDVEIVDFRNQIARQIKVQNRFSLFIDLLKEESVSFSVNIAYQDRLKLSYLLHYLNNEPFHTYNIIDSQLDGTFPLDEMDYFFYLKSSYLIGEPRTELEYFTTIDVDEQTVFGSEFRALKDDLQAAIEKAKYLDGYILDCPKINQIAVFDFQDDSYHPWINEALYAISALSIDYEVPISETELRGMTVQLFRKALVELDDKDYLGNKSYHNTIQSIQGDKDGIINYPVLFENTRNAMKDNIPYELIMLKLCEYYSNENDEDKKHNLSVAQAALLLSYQVDQLKKPLLSNSSIEIPVSVLIKLIGENAVFAVLGISASIVFSYGVGIAFSIISKTAFNYVENINNKGIDERFEQLLLEIR